MCMLGCGLCGDLVVSIFRRIVVDESRVTAAVWGPFDQFLITGHEDGTLAQYNITEVSHASISPSFPLPPSPSLSSLPPFFSLPLPPSPSLSLPLSLSFPLFLPLPSTSHFCSSFLFLPLPLSPPLSFPFPSQIYKLVSTDPLVNTSKINISQCLINHFRVKGVYTRCENTRG